MASGTRERILDCALALFVQHGVAGTSVVQIEEAAGLSPGSGSFYRHFRDKSAVLDAVVARELTRAAEVRAARTPDARPLEGEYLAALDELARMTDLIELLAREGRQRPELFEPVRQVLAEEGAKAETELLQARAAAGEVPPGDLDAVATVAMFALVGHHIAEHFFGMPIGVDRDRFVHTLAALVRGERRPAAPD